MISRTYYPGYHRFVRSYEYTDYILTFRFYVSKDQTVPMTFRVMGFTNQGAEEDWWCWTGLYLSLDGAPYLNWYAPRTGQSATDYLIRSNYGNYDRYLYNGNATLTKGEHTLQFYQWTRASIGDHNEFSCSEIDINIATIDGTGIAYPQTPWSETIESYKTRIKEVHVSELRQAVERLDSYKVNVSNCIPSVCDNINFCQIGPTCQSECITPANCDCAPVGVDTGT